MLSTVPSLGNWKSKYPKFQIKVITRASIQTDRQTDGTISKP